MRNTNETNQCADERVVNAPAMVLAAGRGERMRPLTDTLPKPLLKVHDKTLVQWHLEALQKGGCRKVVMNTAWLGAQIENSLGDSFDALSEGSDACQAEVVRLYYSHEAQDFGAALETAGGIARAMPLLRDEVFWVLAGDVFTPGFMFDQSAVDCFKASGKLAHLWLVPNPEHNLNGDFCLVKDAALETQWGRPVGLAQNLPYDASQTRYTYSTIGLFRAALFALPWCEIPYANKSGVHAALAPLLRAAMLEGMISAEIYLGEWTDVGTPERLAKLNTL